MTQLREGKYKNARAGDRRIDESKREERIRAICDLAEVGYDEYVTALGVSDREYTVVYARDLDELYSNPYNVDVRQEDPHVENIQILQCRHL